MAPIRHPMLILMAFLLDPRTKGGVEIVYGKIKEAMIFVSRELEDNYNINNNMEMEWAHGQPRPGAAAHQPNDMDLMFKEGDAREQHRINAASAELLLCQQAATIQVYKADRSSFSFPLTWWKSNEEKFTHLSH